MKGLLATLHDWVLPFFDPRRFLSLTRIPVFLYEYFVYRKASTRETVRIMDTFPCLLDRTTRTPFDPHYFYQGVWLAQRLARHKPELHVDVGSSVTMIGVLSGQHPIVFLDYRPLAAKVWGVSAVAGDIVSLPFASGSVKSLSCLHVLEHIGLGRYGDPLNPDGSRQAAAELQRVLAPGGILHVSLPVGRERVCFNAHRVHGAETVVGMFGELTLRLFSLVDDRGQYHEDAPLVASSALDYGCGMFEFIRPEGP
jgi:SAM-dependent methyltransferase